MATAAPAEALAALKAPIQSALESKQDVDKPRTWAAAEALAGLLASGALFHAADGRRNCCSNQL